MKKLFFWLSAMLVAAFAFCSCAGSSFNWDGTWSSSSGTIVVTLNSTTMKAEVSLWDGEVKYTTDWEYVDDGSVCWKDYASSQYSMMKADGHLYQYNSSTGRMVDTEVYLKKRQ